MLIISIILPRLNPSELVYKNPQRPLPIFDHRHRRYYLVHSFLYYYTIVRPSSYTNNDIGSIIGYYQVCPSLTQYSPESSVRKVGSALLFFCFVQYVARGRVVDTKL